MNYERVKALHRAFASCEAAFKQTKLDAEILEEAIREKLQMDEDERQAKISDFIKQRDDVNQPPTIRRLAGLELEKLEALEIRPSPEELELFRDLLDEQRQCIHDMNGLRRDFKEALKDTQDDLVTMRAAVLGSSTADLAPRWVDGIEANFSQLAGGGSHG